VGVFRSRPADGGEAARTAPRDVESLERLIVDLGKATDEASTWRITVDSTIASHHFGYGAVWLPDGRGKVSVQYENGTITRELQAVVAGRTVPADAGLVGRAFRSRQPV
jgi:hypothetical protein